jgi:aminopeptidase N
MQKFINLICSTSILLVVSFVHVNAQKQRFTLEDSLRGQIGPARSWWDVTFYDLSVSVDPATKSLSGHVVIRYKVLNPGNVLQVDLQPPLVIDNVLQNGERLEVKKEGRNAHMVRVSKNQVAGEINSIEISYSGKPIIAKEPPWDGGFQFVTDREGHQFLATSCQGLGASAWWPNKDHSYDEPDSMRIAVTVPKPLIDVSNGRLRRQTDNTDGTTTFEWYVSNPINNYGVNVNAANYVHFADTLHGEKGVLDLDFYVLPYNLEKAKKQFSQAKLMLRAFEHWFGPYPFYEDGYKLVETPYLGMEHQSSVTYGNGYQNGYRGRDLSGTGWGLKWDFIIIHESGHEWFANNITYKDIADMWIHESFTNYSETLFTEYYFGKEAGTDYNVGTRKNIKNDIPIIGIYDVNKKGSGDMYPKGGNMLHTIRHSIDDDAKFRNILRGLNETFYHKTVGTKEIEDYISRNAGIDFSKVFDQYLRTTKVPKLEFRMVKKGLKYRWTNVVDGFNLRLKLSSGRIIQPTTDWKKMKIKNGAQPIDAKYLERMYYISVANTSPSDASAGSAR